MTDVDPPVVLRRVIRASCADVFRAWSDPGVLQLWLAPGPNVVDHAEVDFRPGGAYRLDTRGPDGTRHRITGCYREIEPPRRLVQTWIYHGPLDLMPDRETLLAVDLQAVNDRSTQLVLTHRLIDRADVRQAYCDDWPSCFDKLETVLTKTT